MLCNIGTQTLCAQHASFEKKPRMNGGVLIIDYNTEHLDPNAMFATQLLPYTRIKHARLPTWGAPTPWFLTSGRLE